MRVHPKPNHRVPGRDVRGFTLVEMLLVLAILALLAGIIYPNLSKRQRDTRIQATQTQIAAFTKGLEVFELDNGNFPKGRNGLTDLVIQPRDAKSWRGPYFEKLPKDPWGNDYIYDWPGKHPPRSFDLMSAGPDGVPGTPDDITNWQ